MAQSPSLRARALQALARREHSRQELQAKLQAHCEDPAEVGRLLDDLEQRGWLSEARFVEQLSTVRGRKFGAARILHELREKGVSEPALAAAGAKLRKGELAAARAIWRRKFGTPPRSRQERGKQARFLAGRGFSAEIVRQVLKGADPEEE
jgi:regulatory protein